MISAQALVETLLVAALFASPTLLRARGAGARITMWWRAPRLLAARVVAESLPDDVASTLRAAGCYVTGDEYSDVYWLGREAVIAAAEGGAS